MMKRYVSLDPVRCKAVPLRHGHPLPFEVGKMYDFVQMGRIFVYYRQGCDIRRTGIVIGYRQFKVCFE